MRTYPTNSPEAAARIIALTLIADGDVNATEFDLLNQLAVPAQIGLTQAAFQEVFDELCADLLSQHQPAWTGDCPVDYVTLSDLMNEIEDPQLRRLVLGLCVDVAEADGYVAVGESAVLVAAVEHWGLHHHMLQRGQVDPAIEVA